MHYFKSVLSSSEVKYHTNVIQYMAAKYRGLIRDLKHKRNV